MIEIAPLHCVTPEDIDQLLDAAFGRDRHARTAYLIRAGVPWLRDLSFAAVDDRRLVGSVQCWPVALKRASGQTPLTLVGPVAVHPGQQRSGIGKQLMQRALAAATGRHPALVLIGDEEYYGRFFGFSSIATARWMTPGPVDRHRLLARIEEGQSVPDDGMLGPDTTFASQPSSA